MSICFSAEKKIFRDFRFSFPRKSSFPRRIPGSAEGTPCLYHACAKEDGGLAGGSAVKCRKAMFAYVAKRKSSSRTLYTCWKKKKKKEILILKVWFYGNSVKLRQSPTHDSINARFCWQTRIRSRVISILSAPPTDCLKNKVCLWICFPQKKIFPRFSIFIFARILVSATNSRLWIICIMRVQKKMAAWRAKCRKMPESDICLCRKAKVVESHIVYILKWSKKKEKEKKKKEILILKVWFYGNSVKLRQSPTHVSISMQRLGPKLPCFNCVFNYFRQKKPLPIDITHSLL